MYKYITDAWGASNGSWVKWASTVLFQLAMIWLLWLQQYKNNIGGDNSATTCCSKHYNSFPFSPIWVDPLCNNASKIQSAVWSCSCGVKRIFCVGMWQWMKHGSTTRKGEWALWLPRDRRATPLDKWTVGCLFREWGGPRAWQRQADSPCQISNYALRRRNKRD